MLNYQIKEFYNVLMGLFIVLVMKNTNDKDKMHRI